MKYLISTIVNFMYRANLSNDYFTNRQDRYIMIEDCEDLCDFYCRLIEKVCSFSFKLNQDEKLTFSTSMKNHPYEGSISDFAEEASKKVQELFQLEMIKRFEQNSLRN